MYDVSPYLKPLTLLPEVFEYVAGRVEKEYSDICHVFGLCSTVGNLIWDSRFTKLLPYSGNQYERAAANFHMTLLSILMKKAPNTNYWWPSYVPWGHDNEEGVCVSPRIIACQLAAEMVRDMPKTPTEAWRKGYYRTAVFLKCVSTEGLCYQMVDKSRKLVYQFGFAHWYSWDLEDACVALLKGHGSKIRTTPKKAAYWWHNPPERKLALSELIHRAFIEDIRDSLDIY